MLFLSMSISLEFGIKLYQLFNHAQIPNQELEKGYTNPSKDVFWKSLRKYFASR